MSTRDLHRHTQKVQAALDLARALPPEDELHAHWARYLCILISGYIETAIRDLLTEYARTRAQPPVARYVERRLQGVQNLNMEKIVQLAGDFDKSWAADLKDETQDRLRDAINSVVGIRNQLAHGRDHDVTVRQAADYFESAKHVVALIERRCCIPAST